eukprot:750356-Hanusia_phi.AAC.1
MVEPSYGWLVRFQDIALVFQYSPDNGLPPKPHQVIQFWRTLQNRFPRAKVFDKSRCVWPSFLLTVCAANIEQSRWDIGEAASPCVPTLQLESDLSNKVTPGYMALLLTPSDLVLVLSFALLSRSSSFKLHTGRPCEPSIATSVPLLLPASLLLTFGKRQQTLIAEEFS